jgi:hypothetical protein
MLKIEQVDLSNKKQVNEFVMFPFKLYANCKQWVPPFIDDIKKALNPNKHPFYEHSEAVFFLAYGDGEVVGRIAALDNKLYNQYHNTRRAAFYYFETIDDQEVANGLFERAFEWAKKRNLDTIIGPKGVNPLDGYGILVKGFEHHPMMTMLNYNLDYYPRLVENLGFEKEVDFVSCYHPYQTFVMPEKIRRVAERVREKKTFEVVRFRNKRALIAMADQIGQLYNKAFVNNWEYYPLTDREIKGAINDALTVADHRLIKIIMYKDELAGFLFAFPDVSFAMQRMRGRITPWGIADLLLEMRRTKWITFNGTGILANYHGLGGNALMYSEMQNTVRDYHFEHIDMPQVAETAVQMRKDLINLGGKEYKNHRVYRRSI